MSLRIFRVTVRGRFDQLDGPTTARLLDAADDHDVVTGGGFTEAGTLVYERSLDFWTFRVQLREDSDDAEADALLHAVANAEAELGRIGAGHRDVKASAIDMASMWERTGTRTR